MAFDTFYLKSIKTCIPAEIDQSPKLDYMPPLFRRRLSQLTRMTVESVHDLLAENPDFDKNNTKIVSASYRGELTQEFKVNTQFATEGIIMPAAFTLSVFNCAVAQTTIAFGLKGGYSAVYPKQNDFYSALSAAVAPLLAGDSQEILFLFGDERIIEQYNSLPHYKKAISQEKPFAFAAILSSQKCGKEFQLSQCKNMSAWDFMA